MKIIPKLLTFFIIFTIFTIFINSSYCIDNSSFGNIDNNLLKNSLKFSSNSSEINTSSKNIIVFDRKSKNVLYEKNAYQRTAMASTTKIMTCIIAIENSSLSDTVKISKNTVSTTGSLLGLKENSEITLNDLLYGLMLRSGNDCAVAIAEHISGNVSDYIKLMNDKALELGLQNTHFVTPHGLDDDNHYTTAFDLAILTDYALNNPTFKKIVSTSKYNITLNGNPQTISNTNELLNIDGVYGVKTGFTFNAGRCLVTSYKKENLDIIIVVLGANTKKIRGLDTVNLIDYISKNFKYVDISNVIQEAFDNYTKNYLNSIILQKTNDKPILVLDNYEHIIPINTNKPINLKTKIYMPNTLSFNNKTNIPVGILYIYNNTNLISYINIYLENELKKLSWKSYFKYIFYYLKMWD